MDKYARQSHKTSQRARRRNNTAQYLLENQLKQLDKELRFGQVAYRRSLNRVKSDLSNMEGISSDFDLPIFDNTPAVNNADTGYSYFDGKSSFLNNADNSSCQNTVCRRKVIGSKDKNHHQVISSLSSSSSSSVDDDNNNRRLYAINQREDHIKPISSSTPLDYVNTSQKDTPKSSNVYKHQTMTSGSCDFNPFNLRMPHTCNHFPCKTPETYHALGFRRDDLCPWNGNPSSLHANTNTNSHRLYCPSMKIEDTSQTDSDGYCQANKKQCNTNWIKNNNVPKPKFSPVIRGPAFGFRPTDPVLERIRQHRKEPQLSASRPCARVTIRDRIRGVKQLVKEMKLSNEKVKPNNWATNYGKRVPTRVLLNPVVPVSLEYHTDENL